MELTPGNYIDRLSKFAHKCAFKNASGYEGFVGISSRWKSMHYGHEGASAIYRKFSDRKETVVYCYYQYRGKFKLSGLDELSLVTRCEFCYCNLRAIRLLFLHLLKISPIGWSFGIWSNIDCIRSHILDIFTRSFKHLNVGIDVHHPTASFSKQWVNLNVSSDLA